MTNVRADIVNREDWLLAAIEALRPVFRAAGYELPPVVRVSTGFGLTFRGENATILAQTIAGEGNKDGIPAVFVSPVGDDGVTVLGWLVHELCHVQDDCENGHMGRFVEIAKHVGCDISKPTQALPDVELAARLILIADELGDYPHSAVDLEKILSKVEVPVPAGDVPSIPAPRRRYYSGPSKQTGSRMLPARCTEDQCPAHGYTVRLARTWITKFGTPICPGGAHRLTEG